MKDFPPSTERDAASDFPVDPLDRLVEAFVEQSVPEGPDAAMQRRMLAAMQAAMQAASVGEPSGAGLRIHAPSTADEQARQSRLPRTRHWAAIAARQLAGIAAAIIIVAAAALFTMSRQDETNVPTGGGPIAGTPGKVVEPDPAIPVPSELVAALEQYLRTHNGKMPAPEAFKSIVDDYLRDNPRLANSASWRLAQERLTYALEQPAVIGVGVGLLGTLPWATPYARF